MNSKIPTTPVASKEVVLPGSSMLSKMKGLYMRSVKINSRGYCMDVRVVIDGVDAIPLLEDHDQALNSQSYIPVSGTDAIHTATVVRLKSEGFVTSDA